MPRILGFALLATTCLSFAGCSFVDDFSKFKAEPKDAGEDLDAAGGGTDVDASGGNPDGGMIGSGQPDGSVTPKECAADCRKLDSDCTKGVCNGETGKCETKPIREGRVCRSNNGCAVNTMCVQGECKGDVRDCSSFDSDCTVGACNVTTGKCEAKPVHQGDDCDDGNLCTGADICDKGECKGEFIDCSSLDEGCNMGMCDPGSGDCIPVLADQHTACDDGDPCTVQDECDDQGICGSTMFASTSTTCDDLTTCTTNDHCNAAGLCVGSNVTNGTGCDDDNECTGNDVCTNGVCDGTPQNLNQPCEALCRTGATCNANGDCVDAPGTSTFNPQCAFNFCAAESACDNSYQNDGTCDCGCGFDDSADCNPCSMPMCQSDSSHPANQFCDSTGAASPDCDPSWDGDGECDCGCQFEDSDCSGGSCCNASANAGCDNAFVENCVCNHPSNPDIRCCTSAWDATCAAEAVALGCAVCP